MDASGWLNVVQGVLSAGLMLYIALKKEWRTDRQIQVDEAKADKKQKAEEARAANEEQYDSFKRASEILGRHQAKYEKQLLEMRTYYEKQLKELRKEMAEDEGRHQEENLKCQTELAGVKARLAYLEERNE